MRRLARAALVLVASGSLIAVGWAVAQDWIGTNRLAGLVTDLDDQPVAEAVVTLSLVEAADSGPAPTNTDKKGRWGIGGLAAGRYQIVVKATDFLTSQGWVTVVDSQPNRQLSVALRPLAEVTPIFSETPTTVVRWVEKGNDLLEQGHYEEARLEFEKALGVLAGAEQAEVWRTIARTHFLQGNTDDTVAALQRGLLAAPDDAVTRKLFGAVLSELGRDQEATEYLAVLDSGDLERATGMSQEITMTSQADSDNQATPPSRPPSLAIEPLVAGRTGRYRTTFAETSPHSDLSELLRRLGISQDDVDEVDPQGGTYEIGKESFQVYVPAEPRSDRGYGLLVWISPGRFGGFVREEMRAVLDRHGLIWIGADNSGNARARWYRFRLALDAVHNLQQVYAIDTERIYACGYSGGGRITSGLTMLYPGVFDGGLSLFGCDYFDRIDMPDKPGAYWPARFPQPSEETLEQIKRHSRFVLLTGELDFNRAQTRATFKRQQADGFENTIYLQIPEASHYHLVESEWWDRALEALDGRIQPPGE